MQSSQRRYEAWFTRNPAAYHSELLAVRALLPWQGLGLEIGAGTGRFAAPLGVTVGVDPSRAMLAYAVERGVSGIQGIAEALPLEFHSFLLSSSLLLALRRKFYSCYQMLC